MGWTSYHLDDTSTKGRKAELDAAGNAAQILTGPQGDFAFMIDKEEKTA